MTPDLTSVRSLLARFEAGEPHSSDACEPLEAEILKALCNGYPLRLKPLRSIGDALLLADFFMQAAEWSVGRRRSGQAWTYVASVGRNRVAFSATPAQAVTTALLIALIARAEQS